MLNWFQGLFESFYYKLSCCNCRTLYLKNIFWILDKLLIHKIIVKANSLITYFCPLLSNVWLSESLLISIKRMASLTSSFSTIAERRRRAKAVDKRNIPKRFLADVKVMSREFRAVFLSSIYAATQKKCMKCFFVHFIWYTDNLIVAHCKLIKSVVQTFEKS